MRPFFTADWLNLVVLNYEIEPSIVEPFVPKGSDIDFWNGKTFVSIVGFQFLETRVLGLKFPGHVNFEEVNLRFYVKRQVGAELRRGVVFIKEIAPRKIVQWVANSFYNEHYLTCRMKSRVTDDRYEYAWHRAGIWESVSAKKVGGLVVPHKDSLDSFIVEHYWGYAMGKDGSTTEYKVTHPSWRTATALDARLDADVATLYGEPFAPILSGPPCSAIYAEGSSVAVYPGVKII